MKIAILSFTKSTNYGASLQVYALEQTIRRRYVDVDVEYLDYKRDYKKAVIIWISRKIAYAILRKNDEPSYTITEFIGNSLERGKNATKASAKETLELFYEFWALTSYSDKITRKQLRKISNKYDLYIAGSDQLWNCGKVNIDTTYLLDFVKDNKKKASYATSIGLKDFPDKYKSKYKKYLSQFSSLSCREKSAANMVEQLTGKHCENVMDPVFLLKKAEWSAIARKNSEELSGQYVLAYVLGEDAELENAAFQYATQNNLRLVHISSRMYLNKKCGPLEWLWYFNNAEIVFTNSFHGTAFSIIFNKQFWVNISNMDITRQSSDRITDLLNLCGLNNRLLESETIQGGV